MSGAFTGGVTCGSTGVAAGGRRSPASDGDATYVQRRRHRHGAPAPAKQFEVSSYRCACVALNLVAVVPGSRATGEVRHVRPPPIVVSLVDRQVLGHRSSSIPLARRMEERVPVATCFPGAPGTVTTFGLSGCTNCRWLPTVRASVHPFLRRTRSIWRTVFGTAGAYLRPSASVPWVWELATCSVKNSRRPGRTPGSAWPGSPAGTRGTRSGRRSPRRPRPDGRAGRLTRGRAPRPRRRPGRRSVATS